MLRGVVVGFGRMGLTHYSILNSHPEVSFAAVCDSSPFMLKNAAKYMQVETFKDVDKMFQQVQPDFAIVATPTAMHAEVVTHAAACGAHVFVEKPFTLNPKQSLILLNCVEEKKLVHQVGYVMRFSDVFKKVKQLLDAGAMGELLTFRMDMNGPTVLHDAKKSWRSKGKQGGGCLYDFASHAIDLINYLIGPPDKIVGTVLQSIYSKDVEDAATSTFVYRSGLRGNLQVNWSDPSYRKPAYRFEVLGTKGKIVADLHAFKVYFRQTPNESGFTKGWNHRYITDIVEPVRFYVRGFEFTRQLDYFIDCILKNRPCEVCSFKDAFETDKIIDRIRRNDEARDVDSFDPDIKIETIDELKFRTRARLHGKTRKVAN